MLLTSTKRKRGNPSTYTLSSRLNMQERRLGLLVWVLHFSFYILFFYFYFIFLSFLFSIFFPVTFACILYIIALGMGMGALSGMGMSGMNGGVNSMGMMNGGGMIFFPSISFLSSYLIFLYIGMGMDSMGMGCGVNSTSMNGGIGCGVNNMGGMNGMGMNGIHFFSSCLFLSFLTFLFYLLQG
jgi:hypothetical protein